MSAIISEMMQAHAIPGVSVAIGREGEIVFAQGFGQANLETATPVSVDSRFRCASIGKPMTAVVTMMMVEQGRLGLDDPIRRYVPQFPPKPEGEILVRHLLAHESGIRHYTGPNATAEQAITRHYNDPLQALDIFAHDPLVHAPGAGFTYTTWGYVLLGCVIQAAAETPYGELMRQRLLTPVGMNGTVADEVRQIIPYRSGGYVMENGVLQNAIAVDMSAKFAAGGWLTTATDLVRFAMSFEDAALVSRESVARMMQDHEYGDELSGYGLGWALWMDEVGYRFHGHPFVCHGGGTPGVGNLLFAVPELRFAMAFLTNQETFTTQRNGFGVRISEAALGLPAQTAPEW